MTPLGRRSGGSLQTTGGDVFVTFFLPDPSYGSSGFGISKLSRRPSAANRTGTSPLLVTTIFQGPAGSGSSIRRTTFGGGSWGTSPPGRAEAAPKIARREMENARTSGLYLVLQPCHHGFQHEGRRAVLLELIHRAGHHLVALGRPHRGVGIAPGYGPPDAREVRRKSGEPITEHFLVSRAGIGEGQRGCAVGALDRAERRFDDSAALAGCFGI